MKKLISCMLFLLLISSVAMAQERGTVGQTGADVLQKSVQGKVADERGNPLIGATVHAKASGKTTTTDMNGEYTLPDVTADETIEVSYIGYRTLKMTYMGQGRLDFNLEEDVNLLDEVVVIGYGAHTKKELSSSIVQVNRRDFQQGAVSNPMEMITGKVAGLNVVNTAPANPNTGSDLQIRGATSLNAANSPMLVIDGIIGGDIRSIASQDIESITVLKDAASAAIYGTRGANGVILITTRKNAGAPGTYNITYDSWFGVNFAKPVAEVLSAEEFRRSMRGTDYGASTDWYSLLMRDFSYDNNQYLAIDGTTRNGYYGVSLNYKEATGLDIKSERKEYGGRFMLQQRALEDWLEFNTSLNVRRVHETWGDDGMFDRALNINPTMPVYNADGSYFQPTSPTGAQNPVAQVQDNNNGGDRNYILGSGEIKLHILRGNVHNLNTSLSYAVDYNDLKQNYYTPSTSSESFWNGYKGRARVEYQKWWKNQVEWLFNYSLDLDDHSVKAVAGYSYREEHYESVGNENYDFAFDNTSYNNMGSGTFLKDGKANMWTDKSLAKLIGVFGRVNYNWKNTVMASAALRYEGSTKFGENNKWGFFPSGSLAWEVANMDFMESTKEVVNSLKPRVSFGVTGRSDFGTYLSLATYNTSPQGNYLMDGTWVTSYRPSINANPDLAWEKLLSVNAGIDFALFDRVRGSVDWFNRQSRDLLYTYTAPQPPFVYPTILVNVGTTKNTGIEVALEGDVFKGTLVEWTTGVNFSYGTTELEKLSDDVYQASHVDLYLKPGVGTTEYFFRIEEGSRVGQFYGYEHAGVSEDGHLLIYDDQGNKVTAGNADPNYKRHIGNGAPNTFLSWNNTIRYKDFDLSILCRGAFGFEIFNMRRYGMGLMRSGTENVLRDAYTDYSNITNDSGGIISSFFLEKGDFFKIENITLGYNVPLTSKRFIDQLRLYASVKNVYTFTGYSGNDPSIVPLNGLTPGVDISNAYPSALQVSLGLTLRFK